MKIPFLSKKSIQVGWCIDPKKANVIWYPPEKIAASDAADFMKTDIGSQFDNAMGRYFLIRCPFDLNFKLVPKDNRYVFKLLDSRFASINAKTLSHYLHLSAPHQWRHPKRPLVQISTAYRFVSDDHVYISQLPAFPYYMKHPLPGIFISGRFPIDVWPRVFMWAIEIHDIEQPVVFKRGDPWFIAHFEGTDPACPIELCEATLTPELQLYTKQVDGVTKYVNQTFSLFKTAWSRRPKKLLKPRSDHR